MVVLIKDWMKTSNIICFPISCKGFSALKRLNRLMRNQQHRVFSVARLTSMDNIIWCCLLLFDVALLIVDHLSLNIVWRQVFNVAYFASIVCQFVTLFYVFLCRFTMFYIVCCCFKMFYIVCCCFKMFYIVCCCFKMFYIVCCCFTSFYVEFLASLVWHQWYKLLFSKTMYYKDSLQK